MLISVQLHPCLNKLLCDQNVDSSAVSTETVEGETLMCPSNETCFDAGTDTASYLSDVTC